MQACVKLIKYVRTEEASDDGYVVARGGGGSSGRQRCRRRLPDRIDDVVGGLPERSTC